MSTDFQVTIRCVKCGDRYKRKMKAEDEAALARMPDPPCPSCKKKSGRKAFDYAGQAPSVGGSIAVRAVDQTAKIVMEDYKMTDLRSDVREGESMAPKLAPHLQRQADSMFQRPKAMRGNPQAGIMGMNPQSVLKSAVAGRFMTRDTVNPIATQHSAKTRPNLNIIAGDGVRPNR